MQSIYYLLTDTKNKGTVLRRINDSFYGFDGSNWFERGISIGYFYPDAPEFDCFEIITEEEAAKIIGKKAVEMPAQTKERG